MTIIMNYLRQERFIFMMIETRQPKYTNKVTCVCVRCIGVSYPVHHLAPLFDVSRSGQPVVVILARGRVDDDGWLDRPVHARLFSIRVHVCPHSTYALDHLRCAHAPRIKIAVDLIHTEEDTEAISVCFC